MSNEEIKVNAGGSSDPALDMEPVDMYVLFARMFADITEAVEKKFGAEGIEAVREGVKKFGNDRGKDIARRAKILGHENDLEHYLSSYDMARSDFFNSDDKINHEAIEQSFDKCVFAETWKKDGTEKYGIHYCQMIDPSIAEGYNPCMTCKHDKHFFTDGGCHFLFELDKDKKEQ